MVYTTNQSLSMFADKLWHMIQCYHDAGQMQEQFGSHDAYLVTSCKEEVKDAGVLFAQKVLSKLLVLLIKLAHIPRYA